MGVVHDLFEVLWRDYLTMTPQADQVAKLLTERGETIVNDHIALRTFAHDRVDIEVLDRAFVDGGYEPVESYEFKEKKLVACHYEHAEPGMPKVFISALLLDECSKELRDIAHGLIDQIPVGLEADWRFASSGRTWPVDYATYRSLLEESQYAAWLVAFGYLANHFTIATHRLKSVNSLKELNELLKEAGLPLNPTGGLIKGSPGVGLEQSSTMAACIDVAFADGTHSIPSCYYEFAYRHSMADGELFQGFVADSATNLFTSTDQRLGDVPG
ncbi:MAG: DUF1338 domain-containing protein [Myxococcales bacterium]|nr:DUF1338 domain-containing protein [Myxococcales bacterium]